MTTLSREALSLSRGVIVPVDADGQVINPDEPRPIDHMDVLFPDGRLLRDMVSDLWTQHRLKGHKVSVGVRVDIQHP